MNKVVYVKAYFKPVGEHKVVEVPTGEKKKGLFGSEKEVTRKEEQWEQTGWSISKIDGERLSNDIEKEIQNLNINRYEVVSVSMITSGNFDYSWRISGDAGYGYGYGYSYTEGATIVAKKMD